VNGQSNGTVLTVGASVIWGTSFVATSVGLQYSNPYVLLFERFFVATIAILVLGIFSSSARIWRELRRPRTWAIAGVYAVAFLLQFVGQDASGASASALLSNLFVVFVPIAAFFVLGERVPNSSKVAVALGVVGIVLVLPSGFQITGTTLGDLMLVGASAGYTLFIVLGKKYNVSSLASSFGIIVSMTVIVAPLAAFEGGPFALSGLGAATDWESVLWLGVPCTVVALAMFTRGLASTRAVQSATLLLLEIIIGLALSALLLGNVLSLTQATGAGVIALAIILTSRQ